jgi:hypothetical protein
MVLLHGRAVMRVAKSQNFIHERENYSARRFCEDEMVMGFPRLQWPSGPQ